MRKFLLVTAALLALVQTLQSPAIAAEGSSGGFFGFKKFGKKNSADASSKKNSPNVSSEKSGRSAGDIELTEEEQRQAQEMANKIQAKSPGLAKANAKIPGRVLAAPAPEVPQVVAHNAPAGPPKNPNAIIVRIPKPPGKAPQVPNTSGPEKVS